MGTITLKNFRTTADVTMRVRLKDGGIAIDWSGLTDMKAWLYSDAQKAIEGRCDVAIDQDDSTLLVCFFAASKPQYPGVQRIIVQANYMGRTKTYDKPAFNFVSRTADQADTPITIDDPDVTVEIEVEDTSSSILDAAIEAALRAAADAERAAHLIPFEILDECQEATREAQEATSGADAAASNAQEKAALANAGASRANTKAVLAQEAANLANEKAQLADTKAGEANAAAARAEAAAEHDVPYIGENGNWWRWDAQQGAYVDTGEPAQGPQGKQGPQGNTGSSVDYPFELVNNVTTDDPTKALSAAQGVVLEGEISQLGQDINSIPSIVGTLVPESNTQTPEKGSPLYFTTTSGTYTFENGDSIDVPEGRFGYIRYSQRANVWSFTSLNLLQYTKAIELIYNIGKSAGINNNIFNKKSDAYANRVSGRNATPSEYRINGQIVTYLLADGWVTEMFVGDSWATSDVKWILLSNQSHPINEFAQFVPTNNINLNRIFKEIYFSTLTATQVASISDVRIYKDYSESHIVGVRFYDGSSNLILDATSTFSSSDAARSAMTTIFVKNGLYAVIDWSVIVDTYKQYSPVTLINATELYTNSTIYSCIQTSELNLNLLLGKTDAYSSVTEARNAVPSVFRRTGLVISYLLSNGWEKEQFIGSSWSTSRTNWRQLSVPIDNSQTFSRFPVSSNSELNEIIKELYITTRTKIEMSTATKMRIYKDYTSAHTVGFEIFGANNVILVAVRKNYPSSQDAENALTSLFTDGKNYAVIDWNKASSGYKEYDSSLKTFALLHSTEIEFSPYIRSFITSPIGEVKKDYYATTKMSPFWPKSDARPLVYEGDTKSDSNYIDNALSYPDGTIIAARRGGSVVKISLDGTETVLLTISGASDWRCLWMDSQMNVYASPHSAYDGSMSVTDRGLYKLAFGSNSFVKVLSLYDTTSSVSTETENNDDTIWTMCEDDEGNLYAGVYAHTLHQNPAIYKSTDGGDVWVYKYNFKNSGLTPTGKHIHSIIYNQYNKGIYVIVGEVNTIFKSEDGCDSFVNLNVQCEDDKGTCMLAVPDGIIIGSDSAYDALISKLYSDDKTIRTVGRIWANTIFSLRRSDVTGWIYAFTEIDSAVNNLNYYPPIDALTDVDALNTWIASSPTYLSKWQAYNQRMQNIFPDDAIRPQHCSILVSKDCGESWEILYAPYIGSVVAGGFRTTGQFRNGECLTGFYANVGGALKVVRPKIISEGKHSYSPSGIDLSGEIFIRCNKSNFV